MEQFSKRHEGQVIGVLSGFDRVRFRGTLRWLANVAGLGAFPGTAGVPLKDFKVYTITMQITQDIRQAAAALEFALCGMGDRDLRQVLWPARARSAAEERRRAAKVTRQLRLLRAHGLIRKVSGRHRYILTANGAQSIDALLAARNADTEKLQQLAA